jgi:hypothetical protein
MWLADTIGEDRELLWPGMLAWLRADPQLARWREFDERTARRLCRSVLCQLAAWLRGEGDVAIIRAASILRQRRAADLAGSYLVEYLKQSGHLDPLRPRERQQVRDLVLGFFAGFGPRLAKFARSEGA